MIDDRKMTIVYYFIDNLHNAQNHPPIKQTLNQLFLLIIKPIENDNEHSNDESTERLITMTLIFDLEEIIIFYLIETLCW